MHSGLSLGADPSLSNRLHLSAYLQVPLALNHISRDLPSCSPCALECFIFCPFFGREPQSTWFKLVPGEGILPCISETGFPWGGGQSGLELPCGCANCPRRGRFQAELKMDGPWVSVTARSLSASLKHSKCPKLKNLIFFSFLLIICVCQYIAHSCHLGVNI